MTKVYVLAQAYNIGVYNEITDKQLDVPAVEIIGVFDNKADVLKCANDFASEVIEKSHLLDDYINAHKDKVFGREATSDPLVWRNITEDELEEPILTRFIMDTFIGNDSVATTSLVIKSYELNKVIEDSKLGEQPL